MAGGAEGSVLGGVPSPTWRTPNKMAVRHSVLRRDIENNQMLFVAREPLSVPLPLQMMQQIATAYVHGNAKPKKGHHASFRVLAPARRPDCFRVHQRNQINLTRNDYRRIAAIYVVLLSFFCLFQPHCSNCTCAPPVQLSQLECN